MKAILVTLALVVAAALVPALPAAAADGPVQTFSQQVTLGFYRGRVISYLDLGPVKLARANRVEPIWAVTNGPEGQRNIVDTAPGRKDYTPLWAVRMVTWRLGANARVLRSAAAVRSAQRSGEVTVKATPIVVNCPIL